MLVKKPMRKSYCTVPCPEAINCPCVTTGYRNVSPNKISPVSWSVPKKTGICIIFADACQVIYPIVPDGIVIRAMAYETTIHVGALYMIMGFPRSNKETNNTYAPDTHQYYTENRIHFIQIICYEVATKSKLGRSHMKVN